MHRNARLTPAGRLLLCRRIEAGWPVAHAAESMGISRDRAYVWWRRYQAEGAPGLEDRSSRPHRCPTRTKASRERRVVELRRKRGLGPARIAGIVGMPASTVHAVLVRHGLNRLDHLDRATRQPIRRIETARPGELVHVDIKKLARIPSGGGWRAHGRAAEGMRSYQRRKAAVGHAFVHSAIDGCTRIAYSEVLADEQGPTAAGFWRRAEAFFAALGIAVERVLTDNGPATAAASSTPPSATSRTATRAVTGPRPTARPSASTEPSSPSGPTPGPGRQTASGPAALPDGSTPTTITGTTPPSEARP